MSDYIHGGCLCGAVRFTCSGPVPEATYCHCSDCRKSSGSAFHVGLPYSSECFALTADRPKGYSIRADSGHTLTRHFCATCGAPVFNTTTKRPGMVFVKAGALDRPEVVVPGTQIWLQSSVPWAFIDDELPASPRSGRRGSDQVDG